MANPYLDNPENRARVMTHNPALVKNTITWQADSGQPLPVEPGFLVEVEPTTGLLRGRVACTAENTSGSTPTQTVTATPLLTGCSATIAEGDVGSASLIVRWAGRYVRHKGEKMNEPKKSKMRDGVIQRGNCWYYVVREWDPKLSRKKPVWHGR